MPVKRSQAAGESLENFFHRRMKRRLNSSQFTAQFKRMISVESLVLPPPQRHVIQRKYLPNILDQSHRTEVCMALQIGDTAPDFEAETTEGKIRFHDWIGNNWVVLFSHPKDFTPVCTTELGTMARLKPEFDKRGVKDHRAVGRSGRQSQEVVRGHQGRHRLRPELPDDRRYRSESLEALRHAAGEHERHRPKVARPPTIKRCAMCSSSAPTRRSSWFWSIR